MLEPVTNLKGKPKSTILIIGIVLTVLIPILLTIGVGALPINAYDKLFYSRFIYWFTTLLLFFYARRMEQQPFLIWEEKNGDAGFYLLSIIALYVLSLAGSAIGAIPQLFGWHESNEVMKRIAVMLTGHQLLLIFISLTAGITEELIFRGYLLTRLSQLFEKPYLPVIISSFMFSALHYKYHSLHELIGTFLIGVVFSTYYIKYRNIKALMITHFLIDFIAMNLAQHFKLK